MNSITLLQVSQSVIEKSAEMAEKDPHGAIITLVSVSVVFMALILLYYAYTFVGKAVNREFKPKKNVRKTPAGKLVVPTPEEAAAITLALDQGMNGETYAAIGLAIHKYLDDTVHDMESYIITIRRK